MHALVGSCSLARNEGLRRFDALLNAQSPVIIAGWHNRFLIMSALIIKRLMKKGFKLAMMSSLSKDGQLGAIVGKRSGALVVRGSSNRGGTKGVRALYRAIAKEGYSIIILPDGSQGPVYEAKMGTPVLAQLTGAPIIPMSVYCGKAWRAGSWDRLFIPKPFSKISIAIGDKIEVGRNGKEDELEQKRLQLQNELNRLAEVAQLSISDVLEKEL